MDELTAQGRHQEALGAMLESARTLRPCFFFLHSLAEDGQQSHFYLHPQIISDARLVSEFGHLFLAHWEEPPSGNQTVAGAT